MVMASSLDKREIQITIVIKVNPCRPLPIAPYVNSRSRKNIRKCSIPVIQVNVRRLFIITIHKDIEISIVIEITPDGRCERSEERRVGKEGEGCGERVW